jgi:hypothetical protein
MRRSQIGSECRAKGRSGAASSACATGRATDASATHTQRSSGLPGRFHWRHLSQVEVAVRLPSQNAKPLRNAGVVGSAERGCRCRIGAGGGRGVQTRQGTISQRSVMGVSGATGACHRVGGPQITALGRIDQGNGDGPFTAPEAGSGRQWTTPRCPRATETQA